MKKLFVDNADDEAAVVTEDIFQLLYSLLDWLFIWLLEWLFDMLLALCARGFGGWHVWEAINGVADADAVA